MFEFGGVVLVKLQGKLQGGLMRERWVRAIWLGKRWSSDEHVVSLASGKVVRARDARPEPDDRAFYLVLFNSVKGTPSNPVAADDGEDVLRDVQRAPVQRPQEPDAASIPRGVIIHRSYLEKFGYTNTCAKCRAILRKDRSQPTLAHSQKCRARIMKEMEADEQLRKRLTTAQERQDRFLAGRVEQESGRAGPVNPSEDPPLAPPPVVPSDSLEQEDGIPEIGEDEDGEEGPEAKRQRVGSAVTEEEPREAPGTPREPEMKRPRIGTLSVTWADMGVEEELYVKSGLCRVARCDHCDVLFESRNALFRHLRELGLTSGKTPEIQRGVQEQFEHVQTAGSAPRSRSEVSADLAENHPIKTTQYLVSDSRMAQKPDDLSVAIPGKSVFMQPNAPRSDSISQCSRSGADGRATTDETARNGVHVQDPVREPHCRNPKGNRCKRQSTYDVCEIFIPARVVTAANELGLGRLMSRRLLSDGEELELPESRRPRVVPLHGS